MKGNLLVDWDTSVDADKPSTTVLKLDFAQVLQSQLTSVRKPLEGDISVASKGNIDSGFFEVQWEVDGQQETQLHGILRSQQIPGQ